MVKNFHRKHFNYIWEMCSHKTLYSTLIKLVFIKVLRLMLSKLFQGIFKTMFRMRFESV